MSRGTELTDRIMLALSEITLAGGYQTDAGQRVKRGRPESLQLKSSDLPMISVSTEINAPEAVKPRTVRKLRSVEIVGMVDAADRDYEPDLDSLDEDISIALAKLTGIDELPGTLSLEISGGEYRHPDSGSNIAGVTHTVTIGYVLTTKPQP
ncbi:hypothetical protein GCM10011533_30390 [Streptosporangium jomthongense]|uniref:Tail terminator n=1 Tax=Marinobacter aromaticivorans TaxID=1494078 RepID=A0ABW2IYP4_9GAMM|nr:hypothetical protein [Marinobacter aromaticivorans]GGE75929.1 hypothetical protein GCM10011533_30390 [Streptosporangium jomthongense]